MKQISMAAIILRDEHSMKVFDSRMADLGQGMFEIEHIQCKPCEVEPPHRIDGKVCLRTKD